MLQHLGSRDGALLVDVADDEHRHAPALGQLHEGHGAVFHLADAAWRAVQSAVIQRLDGIHDEDVRFLLGNRLEYVLQRCLRQHQQIAALHAQPLSPELQLPHRFLAGDIQHPVLFTETPAYLEHERGLSNPRRAAHQDQGTLYRPTAQYPVQLAHAGAKADFLSGVDIRQGCRLHGMERAPHAGGAARLGFGRGLLFHNGVPRAAGHALSRPLGRLAAALRTIKYGLCFCHSPSPSLAAGEAPGSSAAVPGSVCRVPFLPPLYSSSPRLTSPILRLIEMGQGGGQNGHCQPVLMGLGVQQNGLFAVG